VIGLGMGFLMQITTLVAQNSVAPQEMGVASSTRVFFQQIGGSIGVAAFGAVFARRLIESLTAHFPGGAHVSVKGAALNPATVNHLPALVRADFFVAITHAVTGVFWLVVPAAAIVFLLAWLIKEVPLRGRVPVAEEPVTPELVS
jgi:hypothetical protein